MGGARGGRRASAVARIAVAVAAVALLGGCRADLAVHIDVNTGGGGRVRAVVTLDKAAAAQVPDLAGQLRLEDLEAAGWKVRGPSKRKSGGIELELSKRFSSPAQASRVLAELSGADGPFSTLRIVRRHHVVTTSTALRGAVDLSKGLDAFGDARLTRQLGGPNLGLDPARVDRDLGRPLAEAVTVTLAADLPGRASESWPVPIGTRAIVLASTEQVNVLRLAAGGTAMVSGLALYVLLRRRWR